MRLKIYNPKSSSHLLIYVNPGFNVWHGHYLTQLRALEEGAEKGYFALCHLAHRKSRRAWFMGSPLMRTFSFTPEVVKYGKKDEIQYASNNFVRQIAKFAKSLEKITDNYARICFYQFTGHPHYSDLYTHALKNTDLNHRVFRIYNNYLYREEENEGLGQRHEVSEHNQTLATRRKEWSNVQLVTDSVTFQKAQAGKLPGLLTHLAFPLPSSEKLLTNPPKRLFNLRRKSSLRPPIPADRITVTYFGYPFSKWGYQDAYELYKAIVADEKRDEFWFCIRHQSVNGDPPGYELKAKWMQESNNIHHFNGYLSESCYHSLITQSDVIILPYMPNLYKYATSGVFVESILREKIVITSKGTWMASELERASCGKTYTYGNVEELVRSLIEVAENTAGEIARIRPLYREYQNTYSIDSFAESIFGNIGSANQSSEVTL